MRKEKIQTWLSFILWTKFHSSYYEDKKVFQHNKAMRLKTKDRIPVFQLSK